MSKKIEVGDRFEVPMVVVDVHGQTILTMSPEGSACRYLYHTDELANAKRLPRAFTVGDRVRIKDYEGEIVFIKDHEACIDFGPGIGLDVDLLSALEPAS